MYKLLKNGVLRIADGAYIPADPANSDYAAYLQWVALGNTAAPVAVPTLAAVQAILSADIDATISAIYARFQQYTLEYTARETAARAFKAGGYAGDPGAWVTSFATPTGKTLTQATDIIIGQADGLRTALTALGTLRMRKYELASAVSAAAAQSIHDDIITKANQAAVGL